MKVYKITGNLNEDDKKELLKAIEIDFNASKERSEKFRKNKLTAYKKKVEARNPGELKVLDEAYDYPTY